VIAHEGRGPRPAPEEVEDLLVVWAPVEDVADGQDLVVRADAGSVEQVLEFLVTGVDVAADPRHGAPGI
jgi:hypothetical protein